MFSKADIEKYFISEKQLGFMMLIVAIAAILAGIILLIVMHKSFYKGLAIPFLVIGLIVSIAGYTVYKRSDKDRVNNVYAFDMNPSQLTEKELPRMEKVSKQFSYYLIAEAFFLAAGIFLFIYYRNNPDRSFWQGLGLGLSLFAAIMLVADIQASQKAKNYLNGLQSFNQKLSS